MKTCHTLPRNHLNGHNSTKGVKNGSVNFFPSLSSSLESVPLGGNSIMQTASKIEDKVEGFLFLSLNRELYPPNWQLPHPIFHCTWWGHTTMKPIQSLKPNLSSKSSELDGKCLMKDVGFMLFLFGRQKMFIALCLF